MSVEEGNERGADGARQGRIEWEREGRSDFSIGMPNCLLPYLPPSLSSSLPLSNVDAMRPANR